MGGVGDEVLLDPEQAPDPLGHLIEGPRQRALLGAALDRDCGVEIAGRNPARRQIEAADRPGDPLGDNRTRRRGPSRSTTPASAARSRIEVRTAVLTAATLWVTRTAPSVRRG